MYIYIHKCIYIHIYIYAHAVSVTPGGGLREYVIVQFSHTYVNMAPSFIILTESFHALRIAFYNMLLPPVQKLLFWTSKIMKGYMPTCTICSWHSHFMQHISLRPSDNRKAKAGKWRTATCCQMARWARLLHMLNSTCCTNWPEQKLGPCHVDWFWLWLPQAAYHCVLICKKPHRAQALFFA